MAETIRNDDACAGVPAVVFAVPPVWFGFFELPLHVGAQVMRFAARRCEAQAAFWHDLSQCGDLRAAVERQSRFAEKTAAAYSSEAEAIARTVNETAVTPVL